MLGSFFSLLVALQLFLSSNAQPLVVNFNNQVDAPVTPWMVAAGIEDLNHQMYMGIYPQQIHGESFEEPAGPDGVSGSNYNVVTWRNYNSIKCQFSVSTDAWTGKQSQVMSGTGCALINHGLDTSGMYYKTGGLYSSTFFAKSNSSAELSFYFIDTLTNKTSSVESVKITSKDWEMYTFLITATTTTTCFNDSHPITPCQSTPEGECVGCSGAFVIEMTGGNSVLIDQFYLASADLDPELPLRDDIVAGINEAGFNALRLGGSMAITNYYWKVFRGERQAREPFDSCWYPFESSGWGIFEFLQFCELIDVLPVVTLSNYESIQDLADFVEYVYGDVTTEWGAIRAEDGHPDPYKEFWIELGNEQYLTASFNAWVGNASTAMVAKAAQLNLPFQLTLIVGATWDWSQLNPTTMGPMVALSKSVNATWYWDYHIPADGPTVGPSLTSFLQAQQAYFQQEQSPFKAVVLEENGGTHGISRVLGRGRNGNRLQRMGDFVKIDSGANLLQAFGRNDDAWDQGQVFFTANNTWLTPYGWSQRMIADTLHPYTIQLEDSSSWNNTIDVVGSSTSDGMTVSIRVVNFVDTPTAVQFNVQSCTSYGTPAAQTTLTGPLYGVNPPSNPYQYIPYHTTAPVTQINNTVAQISVTLPAYSFSTLTITCPHD